MKKIVTWVVLIGAWAFLMPAMAAHIMGNNALGLGLYVVLTIPLAYGLVFSRFRVGAPVRKALHIALVVAFLAAAAPPVTAQPYAPIEAGPSVAPVVSSTVVAASVCPWEFCSDWGQKLGENKGGIGKVIAGTAILAGTAALCVGTAGVGCALAVSTLGMGAAIDVGAAQLSGDITNSHLVGGAKGCWSGSLDGCGSFLMAGMPACADMADIAAEGQMRGRDGTFCAVETLTALPPLKAVKAVGTLAKVARPTAKAVDLAVPTAKGVVARDMLAAPQATRAYNVVAKSPGGLAKLEKAGLLVDGVADPKVLKTFNAAKAPGALKGIGLMTKGNKLTVNGVDALGAAKKIRNPRSAVGMAKMSKLPGVTMKGKLSSDALKAAQSAPKGLGKARITSLWGKGSGQSWGKLKHSVGGYTKGADDFAKLVGKEGGELAAKNFARARAAGLTVRGSYVYANDGGWAGTGKFWPTDSVRDAGRARDEVDGACDLDTCTEAEETQAEQEAAYFDCVDKTGWTGPVMQDPECQDKLPAGGFSVFCQRVAVDKYSDACNYQASVENTPEPELVQICIHAGFPEDKCKQAGGMGGSFWYNVAGVMGYNTHPVIESGAAVYEGLSPTGDAVWFLPVSVSGQHKGCDTTLGQYVMTQLGHCGWQHAITDLTVKTWVDGVVSDQWTLDRLELVDLDFLDVGTEGIKGLGLPAETDPSVTQEVLHTVTVGYILTSNTNTQAAPTTQHTAEESYEYEATKRDDYTEGDVGEAQADPKPMAVQKKCDLACKAGVSGGFGGIVKYWWVALILVAFVAVFRNGMLWRWTKGGVGMKPKGILQLHKGPGLVGKAKKLVYGKQPKPQLKEEFKATGVPLVLPPNKEGTGPDLDALKKKLEED